MLSTIRRPFSSLHLTPHGSPTYLQLSDHLNAEVALGTVTSVKEAVTWLSYTYLYVRMRRNPLAYGLPFDHMGLPAGWMRPADAAHRPHAAPLAQVRHPL